MSKSLEYIKNVENVIKKIEITQLENIEKAASLVAQTLQSGGRLHAFGTGHSHMLAEEIFYRAGGLVNVNPILEGSLMLHESASKSTRLERLSEYGKILFDHYGLKKGDLLLVFSNSGRNGVSIDLAALAKENDLSVVVITCMAHTMNGVSRHPSGKKLFEFGDVVIDNCGREGDAAIDIDNFERRVAPTSTAAGTVILNAVVAAAVQQMVNNGFAPEVFASSNVDGGDDINEKYLEKYRKEIPLL